MNRKAAALKKQKDAAAIDATHSAGASEGKVEDLFSDEEELAEADERQGYHDIDDLELDRQRELSLQLLLQKFRDHGVVKSYCHLLEGYATNGPELNHCVVKVLPAFSVLLLRPCSSPLLPLQLLTTNYHWTDAAPYRRHRTAGLCTVHLHFAIVHSVSADPG